MKNKTNQNFAVRATLKIAVFFAKLKTLKTGKISDIYIIKNKESNIFLIKTGKDYIAIDAGKNADLLQKELDKLKIDALDVKYVLLTHTDFDHIAGLSLFKNAKIYINEDEFQLIDGSKKRHALVSNFLPANVKIEDIVLLKEEEISLGEYKIKSFKTPGHTVGSMTYCINNKYLFSGDALKIKNTKIKKHPFGMDVSESKKSIEIIKSLIKSSEYVFTAHFGYCKSNDINLN